MEQSLQSFDVCIVCALPEEARAFLAIVQQQCKVAFEKCISTQYKYDYQLTTIKNDKDEPLNLHVSWLPRYGSQEMIFHLSRVLEECQPRIAIMTGICAGDAQKVQLGDLVIAERIFAYDNGKFTRDEQGRSVHLHDTLTYQIDANILQFLGLFDDWKPLLVDLQRPPSSQEQHTVACHIKAMASGSAVRTDNPFKDVRTLVRGTVAIDMEGAAFGLVMSRRPLISWLVVKGVCDYADRNKNDIYHDYAARASALYALSFIRAYVTDERLPRPDESLPSRRAEPPLIATQRSQHILETSVPRSINTTSCSLSLSNSLSYYRIFDVPPLTDPSIIQQRTELIEDLTLKLAFPHLNAIVLTGLGGVGKSTTAALLCKYIAETMPFSTTPLWLTIDKPVTFADLAGNLGEALRISIPHLSQLSPQSQALALFHALASQKYTQLIVLDQFENLLDGGTGRALSDRPGIGEFLDILNSHLWNSKIRLLLTSRLYPRGARTIPPTYLQEYPVEGLTTAEGVALLRMRGVHASERDLCAAVAHCQGHALSLELLIMLVKNHTIPLSRLLIEMAPWENSIAYLLNAIFQPLQEGPRALLQAFSVYRIPVSLYVAQSLMPPILQEVAPQALNVLLMQHILQPTREGLFQLHALVATYARQHFVEGDTEANTLALLETHARTAQYYEQRVNTDYLTREQRRNIGDVQPLIEAVWHWIQATQWSRAFDLVEKEGLFIDLERWGGNAQLLEICQWLLAQATSQLKPKQMATIYTYLGKVSNTFSRQYDAITHFQCAQEMYQELEDFEGTASIFNNLGDVYADLNDQQRALDYFQKALTLCRGIGDRHGEGMALVGLGRIHNSAEYYQQALVIYQEIGDRRGEGTALNDLGRIADFSRNKQEALIYYQQALVIYQEIGDRRGEGMALNNLAGIYDDSDEAQKALEYYQQALTICREIGDRHGEHTTLGNLGHSLFDLGNKPEALEYYQQALTICREIGDRHGEVMVLNNLGILYESLKDAKNAIIYIEQALIIYHEIDGDEEQIQILNNLGLIYQDSIGDKKKALECFQQALELGQKVGNGVEEALSYLYIQNIYREPNC